MWGFDVTANKKYLLASVALLVAADFAVGASAQVTSGVAGASATSSGSFRRDRNISVDRKSVV